MKNINDLSKWLDKNFFVVTSDTVDTFESDIYGYMFCQNTYISEYKQVESISDEDLNDAVGAYIIIRKKQGELYIQRDSMGVMRLYYYSDDNYWAVSNSFFKLLETVGVQKKITLNIGDAESLFLTDMMSQSVFKTLVNEIKSVPIWSTVYIDIKDKKFRIDNDYRLKRRVNIDSEEGMRIIDTWINKWAKLYKGLELGGWRMRVELSGGFDSRTVFALVNYSGIKLNSDKIIVFTSKPVDKVAKEYFNEDYEIVEDIARDFNFKVCSDSYYFDNQKVKGECWRDVYKYCMLDDMNQVLGPELIYDDTVIRIGGHFGETVRGYWDFERMASFADGLENAGILYDALLDTIDSHRIATEYTGNDIINAYSNSEYVMMETLDEKFFGKQVTRWMMSNMFMLSPFMDYTLRGLDVGEEHKREVIYALIIKRCCPELLNYRFDRGHKFEEDTLKYVDYLCNKYPMLKAESTVAAIPYRNFIQNKLNIDDIEQNGMFEDIKNIVENYYKEGIYSDAFGKSVADAMFNKAVKKCENGIVFHSEDKLMALYAIGEVLNIIKTSKNTEPVDEIADANKIIKLKDAIPDSNAIKRFVRRSEDIILENNLEKLCDYCTGKDIYLYGTGVWADKIFRLLQSRNTTIHGFVVTNKNCIDQYNNFPVYTLEQIVGRCEGIEIIPAVSGKYYDEIVNILQDRNLPYVNVVAL